jgi:hypothetical protein
MYLTTTYQLLRLLSAERNKRIALGAVGNSYKDTGCTIWSSNPGRGQNISEFQQGARHFYLLQSFLFNGYRFFFTTHLYPMAGLRMSGAILLILLHALMTWTGT